MNNNRQVIFCLVLSLLGYLFIGYGLQRENFLQLASTYVLVFVAYVFLIKKSEEGNEKLLLTAAIIFRLAFAFSIPALSDDYFRFVWDGRMTNLFHNPYTVLPSTFIQHSNQVDGLLEQLFIGMNSQHYYTVYPPVLQFIFAFASLLFPHNLLGEVSVLHAVCIAADVGNIFLIRKLLNRFQLRKGNSWWYALNPLVIIELSGNLHFEAVMIFFLLLSIYFFQPALRTAKNNRHETDVFRSVFSAIAYAFAICSKLIPLLFLPFFLTRWKWKSQFLFYPIIVLLTCTLLFLPFADHELFSGFASSINLYFHKFEFNASFFYLIRWIGFKTAGYDIIDLATPWLAATVFVAVMMLMISEKKITMLHLFEMMQWALTIYLLLATTVHPWYVAPLIMMSVFTGFRFAIVWSLFIILSYSTYQVKPYVENLWFTSTEYAAVFVAVIYELEGRRRAMGQGVTN